VLPFLPVDGQTSQVACLLASAAMAVTMGPSRDSGLSFCPRQVSGRMIKSTRCSLAVHDLGYDFHTLVIEAQADDADGPPDLLPSRLNRIRGRIGGGDGSEEEEQEREAAEWPERSAEERWASHKH